MTQQDKRLLCADFILFLVARNVKLTLFDVEQVCREVLNHDNLTEFFYDSKSEKVEKPERKAREILKDIENEKAIEAANRIIDILRTNKDYADGFDTGKNWKDNYTPGGPWHYHPSPMDSVEKRARATLTVIAHQSWMLGFNEGFATQNRKLLK